MLWLLLGPSYVDTSAATDAIEGTFALSLSLAAEMEFEPLDIGSGVAFSFGGSGVVSSVSAPVTRFTLRGLPTPALPAEDD
jgi:hypothetical protein